MPRLPVPGSDGGSWGSVLNEYLEVAHDSSGNIKRSALPIATDSEIGAVQLNGDLSGTATSPTVPELANKASSGANNDITSLSGLTTALSIGQGGTGQTSASDAFNALAPSQSGQSGKYLTTDGNNTSWSEVDAGGISDDMAALHWMGDI